MQTFHDVLHHTPVSMDMHAYLIRVTCSGIEMLCIHVHLVSRTRLFLGEKESGNTHNYSRVVLHCQHVCNVVA